MRVTQFYRYSEKRTEGRRADSKPPKTFGKTVVVQYAIWCLLPRVALIILLMSDIE